MRLWCAYSIRRRSRREVAQPTGFREFALAGIEVAHFQKGDAQAVVREREISVEVDGSPKRRRRFRQAIAARRTPSRAGIITSRSMTWVSAAARETAASGKTENCRWSFTGRLRYR